MASLSPNIDREGRTQQLMDLYGTDPALLTQEEELEVLPYVTPAEQSFSLDTDDRQADRDHLDENLALALDDSQLFKVAEDVFGGYTEDRESRSEWRAREAEGMHLLGVIGVDPSTIPFEGASEAVHPMFAEACIHFQAEAQAEFFPPQGPAKADVIGNSTDELEQQAKRVKTYLNYQYTELMPDAFDQDDRMLMRLPYNGSAFKKQYYDPLLDTVVTKFIEPSYFVVNYLCESLKTAERYTDTSMYMSMSDIKRRQQMGVYVKATLTPNSADPRSEDSDFEVKDAVDEAEGTTNLSTTDSDYPRRLLQQYVNLDLPGFEDEDDEGITGIRLPYIVTVDLIDRQVLAINRNWKRSDPLKQKIINFTHYKFLPGFGFYGWGFLHIMGSLAKASSGALRALLDSAQFANLQGGLSSAEIKPKGKNRAPSPGEFLKVDAPDMDIRQAFMPWPYKEPSKTLFELLQYLDEVGRRIASITDMNVGDANPRNAPVGTVLALIEQAQKRPHAIHKRLFNSRREELRQVSYLNSIYLPEEEYPYSVSGDETFIMAQDFDDRVDVLPVADPDIISNQQRLALAQSLVEVATANPDLYNRYEVHKRLLTALRIRDHDELLNAPQQAERMGPVEENMAAMTNQPMQVYPDQDHQAHIAVHWHALQTLPESGLDPSQIEMVTAALMAHIAEHVAINYQLTVQSMMANAGAQPMSAEQEALMAQQAAQAVQLLSQQQANQATAPTPDELQANKKTELDEMRTLNEIRRADAVADADIARKDAIAISDVKRKKEMALAQQFATEQIDEEGGEAANNAN